MRTGSKLALAGLAAALASFQADAGEIAVDLELVLAIDASASVDPGEFELQLGGIAAAIRDGQVHAAIAAGPAGRIAIATLVWADATLPKQAGAWHLVESPADAELFARHVLSLPRTVSGGTGLGSGIVEAMRLFDRNGIAGTRRVVDVSGDGIETPPRENVLLLADARGMALGRGVTVNGLAILTDVPDLDAYYRAHVAVGDRAFVIAADDYGDFAGAFRRKLLREIEDRPPISYVPAPAPPHGAATIVSAR